MESDKDLIIKYLDGEKRCFDDLRSRYINYIYNFIVRYSGDRVVADDLLQETFLRVWKNLKHFDTNKKFITWALAIARNVVIDWQRKRKNLSFSELNADDEDFSDTLIGDLPSPEELFDQKFLHDKFVQAVEELSNLEQSIILLHLEQELTFAEIADILNKPVNSVKSVYRRAVLKIKDKWPDYLK
jgi:RNA polymerase sigma-70 factor (ECF subfamily)